FNQIFRMTLTHYQYTLQINEEFGEFNLNLYESSDMTSPLISLTLKPLWITEDENEPYETYRSFFKPGDYYQAAVVKHTNSENYRNASLLSLMHDIIIENSQRIPDLKNVYSSSLNRYEEESFFTYPAIHFWIKQLGKAPN